MDEGFERTSEAVAFIDFLDTLKSCGFSYKVKFDYYNDDVNNDLDFTFDEFFCKIEICEPHIISGDIVAEGRGTNILDAFNNLKTKHKDF